VSADLTPRRSRASEVNPKVTPLSTQADRFRHNLQRFVEVGEETGCPLAVLPVTLHAYALLLWVQRDQGGKEVRADHLQDIYAEMCLEHWWHPIAWKHRGGVGEAFRAITGSHPKVYRWFVSSDGERLRRCVYLVPARASIRSRRRVKATAVESESVIDRALAAAAA
jgi:hypothetical protein